MGNNYFCDPKQYLIPSDERLPTEGRDELLPVAFIPRVSPSWFLTTRFNHQTVFHVVPSSSWAESLQPLNINCLCLPPGAATVYLHLVVLFSSMEIKEAKTEIIYRAAQNMNIKNTPPAPSWLRETPCVQADENVSALEWCAGILYCKLKSSIYIRPALCPLCAGLSPLQNCPTVNLFKCNVRVQSVSQRKISSKFSRTIQNQKSMCWNYI